MADVSKERDREKILILIRRKKLIGLRISNSNGEMGKVTGAENTLTSIVISWKDSHGDLRMLSFLLLAAQISFKQETIEIVLPESKTRMKSEFWTISPKVNNSALIPEMAFKAAVVENRFRYQKIYYGRGKEGQILGITPRDNLYSIFFRNEDGEEIMREVSIEGVTSSNGQSFLIKDPSGTLILELN